MDNCCAPQWADFTRSPQIFSDDYFEIEHEVHKPQMYFKYSSNLSSCNQENRNEQSVNETKFDDSLESGTSVCSSVVYFIPHDNKNHAVVQITNNEPRKELKLDEKSSKIHETWSVSITELTSAFKVTPTERKVKRIIPKKSRKDMSEAMSSLRDTFVNDVKKTNNPQTIFVKNKHESTVKSKVDVCSKDNPSDRRLSYKIVRVPKTQHNALNTKQYPVSKPKVLTCQYRRTSLIKKRSNQFVSLAEAISKFQTETPERFRTLNNRTMKPGPLMKLKQSPLKLTYPVSPALRCKQRIRTANALNQQEREKLELENMKKRQIKANPVPVNILKGPTLLKKVPKKPATITEEFHLTQSKKIHHTTNPSVNIRQNMNAKEHQKTVSTSSSSVSCKKANSFESEVKAAVRDEFEFRNKEFQLKKQEKLRNLCVQESDKIKTQFHARPAPKFSKSTSAVKDQKQKRNVITHSSSLEERNRFVAKKNENCPGPVKQFERLGTTKILNTNSIPCFIRGSEKENIRNKGYSSKALETRQTKSFSDGENKQSRIINNTIACLSTKKKQTVNQQTVNRRDKLQNEICMPFIDIKNKKLNDAQNKVDKLKVNMKKKVQERNEFDDMIKKREQEFKAKKLQEEKCRLLEQKMEKLKLRKMTEVKAKPMPIYKPMVIAKSTKPVTNPQSPALGIRNKAKSVCQF
ncbi:hypothetical protein E2986_07424 [Frieseomelitta varia]|uniref:Targeting protein for Xklp2 n=2 Tax=Frieseomelitta varia TaxID=561572 RepID=A0A833S0B3_9HYME|nr:hypothetical protein E2986_07424 [Frieseomelitta varia]